MRRIALLALAAAAVSAAAAVAAQARSDATTLVVYSGRDERFVKPILDRFTARTGIRLQVRYGDSAALAATLLEEGRRSPADVFVAQDAGALGAVAAAGMLSELPADLLERVPAALRSPAGEWVAISGRARTVVYDSRELAPADLPASIDGITDPAWRGRIGWAPTNGSFQAFVTAYRQLRGDDAARAWLEGMLANQPRRYEGNTPIVQAVADGEIDVGLVNHYYAIRARAEQGADFPARNHFFTGDDPGALVNVAGAGVLAASDVQAAGEQFIEFLLSEDSQRYFASETFEYPLIAGVPAPEGAPSLEQLAVPDIDLSDLSDLAGTLRMLQEVGVLP